MKRSIVVSLLAFSGAMACSDRQHAAPALADLVLRPTPLDFGEVPVHARRTLTIAALNAGTAPLPLINAWIEGDPNGYALTSDGGLAQTLASGEERRLEVVFAPETAGFATARIAIATDQENRAIREADLVGVGIPAAVTLQTSELDFGRIEVESSEQLAIQVENVGPLPATVSPELIGADVGEFDGPTALFLVPGQSARLPVTFHPSTVGKKVAAVAVSPCAGCADDVVAIRAEGLAQAVVADPPVVDFGDVPIAIGAEGSAGLQNISSQPMTVTGMALPPGSDLSFDAPAASFPVVLQAGEVRTYPVHYVATHMGPASATLAFSVVSRRNPQTRVTLQGHGGAAELCVYPSSYDFGEQPVGSNTQATVTLRNCGTSSAPPLQILGADFAAAAVGSPFSSSGPTWPMTLAAQQQVELHIFYAPTSPGPSSATFEVQSSGFRSQTATVPVTGSAAVHAPCDVALTPGAVDFGTVPPGTGAVLGIKIRNPGNDVCAVKNIQLADGSGPFGMPGGPIPGLLVGPGDWFSFQVSFTAASSAAGTYAGALQIEQSNRGRPVIWVPLSANVQPSCLVAAPPYVDFGVSRPDCPPAPRRTTLLNQCPGPVTVDRIWIGPGTTDGAFSILQSPALPLTLAPTDTASVQLAYSAQSLGMELCPLYFDVPGLERPQLVPLLGESDLLTTTTDTFTQQAGNALDVLLVVDNTAAMALQQPELVRAIPAFVNAAVAAQLDLHVGVTTTGLSAVSNACPGGAQGGEAGRLFPADNSLPRILTQGTPDLTQALQDDVSVGLCAVTPRGLDAMRLALSPPLVNNADDPRTPLPNDGNLGFLRGDAALALVFVSSRDDDSADDVPTYVQFLQALKGPQQPQRVTAFAVAPTNVPCPTAGGTGTRYDQVAAATGGQSLDVCATDYGPLLAAVAAKSVGPQSAFPLSGTPEPGTLMVSVNGSPSSGWSYDATGNAVDFATAPAAGTTIAVSYTKVCTP